MNLEKLKSDIEANVPSVKLKPVRESLLIENTQDLPKVVTYLKDSADYRMDYLSSLTASDFVTFLETVYHLYSIEKKIGPITLRVRCTDREHPKVPSLVPIYRGAEYQERDAYDLYGIEYEGHPDPRRIMMWEGFDGFPMRKDYQQENSEVLEEADIKWLEKHHINVSEGLRKKSEELKNPPAEPETKEEPKT